MRIGFVGYSAKPFNLIKAKRIIEQIFEQELEEHGTFTVVSGGTNLGIPKLVYEVADQLGLPKVGVIASEGIREPKYPHLDHLYIRGVRWGDESRFFISMIDKLYRIGGGEQSLREVAMAKERGIPVVEYDLPVLETNSK